MPLLPEARVETTKRSRVFWTKFEFELSIFKGVELPLVSFGDWNAVSLDWSGPHARTSTYLFYSLIFIHNLRLILESFNSRRLLNLGQWVILDTRWLNSYKYRKSDFSSNQRSSVKGFAEIIF